MEAQPPAHSQRLRELNMLPSSINFTPIGIIHSPHSVAEKTPIQPCYAADCTGHIEFSRSMPRDCATSKAILTFI